MVEAVRCISLVFAVFVCVSATWQAFDLLLFKASPPTSSALLVLTGWIAVPNHFLLRETGSWQQLILDVHSGANAGVAGKLFNDLVGVFVMLLALSSVLMWRN